MTSNIDHTLMIQLAVAYTLVGALIFTVIVTCLSLVGVIKIPDKKQQNQLFMALILELVVGSVAFFVGFLKLDVGEVVEQLAVSVEQRAGEEFAKVIHQRASSQSDERITASVLVSGTGVASHWVSIDGDGVVLANDTALVDLEPGSHILLWMFVGDPGAEGSISVSVRGEEILKVMILIPEDEMQTFGTQLFEMRSALD